MSENDEPMADLLAIVVSGRADPFVEVGLAGAPPEVHAAFRGVREAFASVALAEAPVAPSAGLRSRILQSLAARQRVPRRALLVIDMQNDHLTEGRPLEVPRARGIVPALSARIEDARRQAVPVVYVLDDHAADDTDLDSWGTHNVHGTPGADVWAPLAPKAGDAIVRKPTYSAFSRSDLEDVLARLAVDTLVLTGCLTEIGILATATDALQRGYAVEVPPDSQAGATALNEHVAMGILQILVPYGPARAGILAASAAESATASPAR